MNLLWMQSEMNLKSMRLFLGLDPGVVGEKGLEEYVSAPFPLLVLQLFELISDHTFPSLFVLLLDPVPMKTSGYA
jgi:hypothetical protein